MSQIGERQDRADEKRAQRKVGSRSHLDPVKSKCVVGCRATRIGATFWFAELWTAIIGELGWW